MKNKNEHDCTDVEDCLSDPQLSDDQRHLLAVAIRWQRHHLQRLQQEHAVTDGKLDKLIEAFDDHIREAEPALRLIQQHEKTLDQANTIFRMAFCKTWQFAAALLAAWLVVVEIAEHMGWIHK